MNDKDHSVDLEPECFDEEEGTCGECNECSTFCDVCGFWFPDDEPCPYH